MLGAKLWMAAQLPPPGLPDGEPQAETIKAAAEISGGADFFSLGELKITVIIFAFGLISLGVFYLLLRLEKATPYTLRIFVIIILVFGTLLVVSSAYTTAQIAPIVGFFGTIAGYLLGRTERQDNEK
jgi:hypothetical protein